MILVGLFSALISLSAAQRNFVITTDVHTGERTFRDLTIIAPPDRIGRVRLYLTTAKAQSGGSLFDVFHMRVRWTEPEYWNDDFDESGRYYNIQCAIQDVVTKERRVLVDVKVDWSYNGYDEKFRLPLKNLLVRCRVSAVNSENIRSEWKNSRAVFISLTSNKRTQENRRVAA